MHINITFELSFETSIWMLWFLFNQGITDNSGMRFHVTQNLRPYDAGIIELGLVYSDKMAIPPSQESFSLSGYCLPECTATVNNHKSNLSGTS